jgi:hypothetical protein
LISSFLFIKNTMCALSDAYVTILIHVFKFAQNDETLSKDKIRGS